MKKSQLIEMVESLKAKKATVKKAIKHIENIQEIARAERIMRNLDSVCDRLCFNWNMKNDAATEGQRNQAGEFLENTIAEAELHLI